MVTNAMHYLITGGSGFIGRALSRALVADGERVTVLTRNIARARPHLPDQVVLVEKLDAVRDADVVVNLAGENLSNRRWTAALKQEFRDSRIGTTRRVLDWMSAQPRKPSVLISGSAIGWYGPRGDEGLSEDVQPGDDFPAHLCRDWEAEADKAQALGVRVCRLRTGIVLDHDGGALKKMLLPFRLGIGGPIGSGRQWMSWVSRADLVALIRWLAVNANASGPFNGTAPKPVTNAEFAKALGHAVHRPAVMPMPGFALQLLLGEMSEMVLTGQRVLPVRAGAAGFQFKYAELPAAFAAILG
jgi:uncharacterized protein (TIGR01777 family)